MQHFQIISAANIRELTTKTQAILNTWIRTAHPGGSVFSSPWKAQGGPFVWGDTVFQALINNHDV